MLTPKEEVGIKSILNKLELNDLYSLAFTVTKGFIKPENAKEAVRTVLLYCEKPSLLLRRKKVKKEIIFDYLRENGIVVSVSGEKMDYIKRCLHFWESPDSIQKEPVKEWEERRVPRLENSHNFTQTSERRVPRLENSHNFTQTSEVQQQARNPFGAFCGLNPQDVLRMGQDYAVWFYRLLNQTSMGVTSHESFGEHLFWWDCSFSWLVQDVERMFKGDVNSSNTAMQVVTEMIFCNRLLLEPGVEGVVCSYDPHGIVQVKVGGVVHRVNSAVGLFDQTFGLFRDPLQNDCWKIKKSALMMQVQMSFAQSLASA